MRSHTTWLILSLSLLTACSGVKTVQLHPPVTAPEGIVWGYGTEKLRGSQAERVRQSAYLKAIDDLLSRGPVMASKTVEAQTTVVDTKSFAHTMESTFRLRASQILQPSFMQAGTEDGYLWMLVGTTQAEIDEGWQQFLSWRKDKIDQADRLYSEAKGPDRLPLLKASFSMLEEAGAQDDPSLLYYEVKNALDRELHRVGELGKAQGQFRSLTDSGRLLAAEEALDRALDLGLETRVYVQSKTEVAERRRRAIEAMHSGDALVQNEQYDAARSKYEESQRLDRDNPQMTARMATLEQKNRNARQEQPRSTIGTVSRGVTQALDSFFDYKREEERRKREEAVREDRRQDAERRDAERKAPPKEADKPKEAEKPKETEKPVAVPPTAPVAAPVAAPPQPPPARRDPMNPMPVPEL